MSDTGPAVPSRDHEAAHAECALTSAVAHQRANNLEIALLSNRRIGIAIGLVMAQLDVADLQAFELLRHASMHTNRKLADLAEDVVRDRHLEAGPFPPKLVA